MSNALATDLLGTILKNLNLAFSDILTEERDGLLHIEIVSPTPSRIIGWHGEALNALQSILKAMLRTQLKTEKAPALIIDVDGYRKMQEEKVLTATKRKIDFVRRTGSRVALPPMSPYFRRMVHLYIANTPDCSDLSTESIGEGEYRQVVLQLKSTSRQPADGEEMVPVAAAHEPDSDVWSNLDV